MKIAKHLLALLALALVPAAAEARVPSQEVLDRLALRESIVLRLEGAWRMDEKLSAQLVPSGLYPVHYSMHFQENPLVVQLALTNDARTASLPIFSGGLVNADGQLHPYLLVDRGGPIELMIFHGSSSTSFAWAEVYAVNLLATDVGPRLLLGGVHARGAEVAYQRKDQGVKGALAPSRVK